MPTRLNIPNFIANLERPFELRGYEREWEFDRSIFRLCIQGNPALGAGQFAPLLRAITLAFGPLLLEGDEIPESNKVIRQVLGRELGTLAKTTTLDHRAQTTTLLTAHQIVNHYDVSYSFLIEPDAIETALTRLSATEWWGSYWGKERPRAILAEAFEHHFERVEPLMLAAMEDCSPIFFFAPSHCHLELMAREEQADRILEIVHTTCA